MRVLGLALLLAALTYLALPVAAVFLFAVAERWTGTILPAGWTLAWFAETAAEPRLGETLSRSLLLGASVALADLALVVPALVALTVSRSRWRPLFDTAVLLPFAMPGVVLALAIVRFYGVVWPTILNTPWLLAGAHGALALPIVYWAILNNLKGIRLAELYDAARTSGAGWLPFLWHVVLPNIRNGVAVAAVAAFAASFTDFAVANYIVGGSWLTFSVWQGYVIHLNGHVMAVTAVITFAVTLVTTLVVVQELRRTRVRMPAPGGLR